MASFTDDDSLVGKPGKPMKQRPFPWRLWMYAILITAAAVGAAYFAWGYRSKANTAEKEASECKGPRETAEKDSATCKSALDVTSKKALELEKQNNEFTKNLNATKDELAQLRAQKADADKRMAAVEEIRKQFAKLIDTGQLKVSARRGQLVLSLPSEVLFPTGSSDLSKQGEYAVVEVGAVLKRFPDRRFLVVGHTDNQDFAKPKNEAGNPVCVPTDNWQLSTARSLTVVRVLVTAGMKAENLIPAGVGENDPVASNATPEGRQKNRRIEIALLPAISELPPLPASLTDGK
jgi:chemotaxis protein MotB